MDNNANRMLYRKCLLSKSSHKHKQKQNPILSVKIHTKKKEQEQIHTTQEKKNAEQTRKKITIFKKIVEKKINVFLMCML